MYVSKGMQLIYSFSFEYAIFMLFWIICISIRQVNRSSAGQARNQGSRLIASLAQHTRIGAIRKHPARWPPAKVMPADGASETSPGELERRQGQCHRRRFGTCASKLTHVRPELLREGIMLPSIQPAAHHRGVPTVTVGMIRTAPPHPVQLLLRRPGPARTVDGIY